MENALEVTKPGGVVTVELAVKLDHGSDAATARIIIKDSGEGIAETESKEVLDPFVTTKKDRDGLGLALAARFVELHGGAMNIKSCVGYGTTVEIALPVNPAKD